MDTLSKISAEYSMELTELHSVKILLCYLLNRLNKPITADQLYEIAVSDGNVNYFIYSEAMEDLLKNETIVKETDNGTEYLILAEKGKAGAEQFRQYVPKSFRDKILSSALKFFAKLKRENEVICELIPLENGYYVHCRILDISDDLMELKIFAPDEEQAKLIKEKIIMNPTGFYGKIMNFALDNVEEEFDLD